MTQRSEQASAIWPHLNREASEPRATPRPRDPLASAMYPNLASAAPPKPQPQWPISTPADLRAWAEAIRRG
jgi:hypothetical protein